MKFSKRLAAYGGRLDRLTGPQKKRLRKKNRAEFEKAWRAKEEKGESKKTTA